MKLVTLDFESYYSREYSLSKMTTEAYIRDVRFQIIGVGVKVGSGASEWVTAPKVEAFLHGLNLDNCAILCHNTAFDGAILSWRFGIRPRFMFDTLSMARAKSKGIKSNSLANLAQFHGLGVKGNAVHNAIGKRYEDFFPVELAEYGAYCCTDVDLTYDLFKLFMKEGFPQSELRLIDTILRMYTEPVVELDGEALQRHLEIVQNKKDTLLEKIGGPQGKEAALKLIMSNKLFAEYLESIGCKPPMKISPRTGKPTYAFSKTDLAFLALQDHENQDIAIAASVRLGAKSTIEETRTLSLLGVSSRGKLPIMLNYYGAHTGRMSGGDKLNLQNLPRGGALRKAIIAPKGHVFVSCDSSQIEARMVAYLAGQTDLVQAFREKRDVYSEFASEVYGRKITKADTKERFVGKTSILGMGYGVGAEKFQITLKLGIGGVPVDISISEARRIVSLYRYRNHMIQRLWFQCGNVLLRMVSGMSGVIADRLPYDGDVITLPNGFTLSYPQLTNIGTGFVYAGNVREAASLTTYQLGVIDKADVNATYIYGGKMVENITQALARIVVTEQLQKIATRYRVVLQVHDENAIICKESEADEAKAFMVDVMSTAPSWAPDLPVACEAGIGYSYGDAH